MAVRELVGDGHAKVAMKCEGGAKKRVGRPRKSGKPRVHNHGWFMLVDPQSKHIVGVEPQRDPENNAIVISGLKRALPIYPRCNGFVLDRACKFDKEARQTPALSQLKHIAVDKWHQKSHNRRCKNSPKNVPALKRRFARVNTSIAEQTFSWFRGYTRLFNSMRAHRHHFAVLLFSRKHNALMDDGNFDHLNAFKPSLKKSRTSSSYECNRK